MSLASIMLLAFTYSNEAIELIPKSNISKVVLSPSDSTKIILNTAITEYNAAQNIQLSGKIISGKIIALEYKTLSNNNPKKNKNWIAIWQGSQIHYAEKPLRKILITNNNQDGGLAFDSLVIRNLQYIVGYGSSDSISTASSTLYFQKGSTIGIPFSTSIKVIDIGPNYIISRFTTPLGNTPKDNDNWIGIWKGKTFSYDGSDIIKRVKVQPNVASGLAAINDLTLERQTWYTVVYGSGQSWSDVSATFTFQTK
ncbi:MAG: hypothetical protein MK066_03455 [Crocinitomicaceae bacterium]|nr:hypothetical protein [Crocinitomicaceae bacterium]